MRLLALFLISQYKTHISPLKGFNCAYRTNTGHASCSTLGFRAIRRYGLILGLGILRKRTYLCAVSHGRSRITERPHFSSQRGLCDIGCDLPCHSGCDIPTCSGCDLPSGSQLSKYCNIFSYCDCCSCDWPSRRNNGKSDQDKYVYIPPNSKTRRQHSTAPGGGA